MSDRLEIGLGHYQKIEVNYVDFEKVVFGLEHILRHFTLGKRCKVIADYDPQNSKIFLSFYGEDESGILKKETWGAICRVDCERFIKFCEYKFLRSFEAGKRQWVIVDYDPQNEKTLIEIQVMSETQSGVSSGINAVIGSDEDQITS